MDTRPYDFDDDLMDSTRADGVPRVRVYEWEGVAVVIGRGGKSDLELIPENILADGVPVYKRPGGGCSVVLDPGNLIVSVALPVPGLSGIKTSFGLISHWVIDGLATCGVPDVRQEGVSDLVLGDRKIGGSCIYRTRGLLYYSTTLLVAPDFGLMDHYLQHPPREPEYRRGRRHADFTTSLEALGVARARDDMRKNLTQVLEITLVDLFQATCT